MDVTRFAFTLGCSILALIGVGALLRGRGLVPRVRRPASVLAIFTAVFLAAGFGATTPVAPEGGSSRAEAKAATGGAGGASAQPSQATRLRWIDAELVYVGRLVATPGNLLLEGDVFDPQADKLIQSFSQKVTPRREGERLVIPAAVAVPGDTVTPRPHNHDVKLVFQIQEDTVVGVVGNCVGPSGVCYLVVVGESRE